MTNTKTIKTKTNHYFRVMVALAALAMVVSLLVASTAKPSYAAGRTFTVNVTGDGADPNPGDGTCSVLGFCTLRAAIQEANATPGADSINFNIPGTGVRTISPSTTLPPIADPVIINGFSQPGSSPNTLSKGTNAKLMIELNGSTVTEGTTERTGLRIHASDSVVTGLVINRFTGGVAISDRANFVRLTENFIGTDSTGTLDRGNSDLGIFDQGFGTSIGGNSSQEANLVSGNDGAGIAITELASRTQVAHNLIGTDKSGTKKLGNAKAGVEITGSSENILESNTIAFNGKEGVSVAGGGGRTAITVSANTISSNSIFSNVGLGINLIDPNLERLPGESDGPTANDSGDADSGPNVLQNKPVLTVAKTVSGLTTIKGKVNSHPNETYQLQFYSNPSGTNEGKKQIGQKSITTDGSGNRAFTFLSATKVAVGRTITATITRDATLDTSEFSAPRTVATS